MKTTIRYWNRNGKLATFDAWDDNGENDGLKKTKSYCENILSVQHMDDIKKSEGYQTPEFGKTHPMVYAKTDKEAYRELMKILGIPKTKSEYINDLKRGSK